MNSENNSRPVQGNWEEQKIKLKTKFPTLTDADLHFENGKRDDMFQNLQTKLGKTRKELDETISTL